MINEDSIDESVGAHPTYVHYSELERLRNLATELVKYVSHDARCRRDWPFVKGGCPTCKAIEEYEKIVNERT